MEDALEQTVEHYCKRKSKFCAVAKDLRVRYTQALSSSTMSKYRDLLQADQRQNCKTKHAQQQDRCQALALLWKAFVERHSKKHAW